MEENQENAVPTAAKKGMNPMLMVGIVVLLLIVGGVFYATSKQAPKSQTTNSAAQDSMKQEMQVTSTPSAGTGSPTQESVTTSPASDNGDDQAVTINLEAGSYYYKPNIIKVKKGQIVTISMSAVSMFHNFNIDELNVHGPMVRNGQTQTFSFTPDKVGTFEFYCNVSNHRQMGQVGKLTVE